MSLSRRDFLQLSSLAALSQAAPGQRVAAGDQSQRPNIILLLGDDHRGDALGCMGNAVVKTPHLDRMAAEGVLFQRHFCTTPICCTSRASIMLGQYASTHGIHDFSKPLSPEQVERSYFSILRKAGYYTGFIGKFGVGKTMPETSFDVWNGFGGQGHYFPEGPDGRHLTDIQRGQAVSFLKAVPRDRPFCLSLSFKAPHVQDEDPRQYLPSSETLALYKNTQIPQFAGAPTADIERFPLSFQRSENRRRWGIRFATPALYQESVKGYYRLVSGIDSTLGAIRATLDEFGLADNTIVIYSADHGIFNGEHGLAGKWYAHEESIHIPLIVYDPRSKDRGRQVRATTLNIDLHPTVLELAGVTPPAGTQGRSILPFIDETPGTRGLGEPSDPGRSLFFIEHHFPYNGFIPSSEAIRTPRWKYIRYTDVAAPYEELYDLQADPHEQHNLASSEAPSQQLSTLRAYTTRWKESLVHAGADWQEPITALEVQHDHLA